MSLSDAGDAFLETLAEETLLERPAHGPAVLLRQWAGSTLAEAAFAWTSYLWRLSPIAHPLLHGVEVLRDISYGPEGEAHRLDVYRPRSRPGPLPVVLYIHGGGFRMLSKDTHWVFGLLFARRGYLVLNINYRLAPRHRYPAAVEDACAAYRWALEHAAEYGGDPRRVVVAGESAGANLACGVALAACWERREPWARAVYDTGTVPVALLPACGLLQVTDIERYARARPLDFFSRDRLSEASDDYLHGVRVARVGGLDFADPLVALERGEPPARPLPPTLITCGTGDVLVEDSRRLEAALHRLGAPCEAHYYPDEPHAFHALVVQRAQAHQLWRDTFRFLKRRLPPASGPAPLAPRPAGAPG